MCSRLESLVPDDEVRLAALGVLSHDQRYDYRQEIRSTWALHAAPHIIVRFALRGIGASAAVRAERANFTRNGVSDVVLLDASANASRARGPLASLFCWYRCATTAWPRARLVGKADDDVWLHLPGISAHLHASLHALRRNTTGEPQILWGLFQSFHWDVRVERPDAFGKTSKFGSLKSCGRAGNSLRDSITHPRWRDAGGWWQHPQRIGPFHFTRGPAYFVGAGIVRQLLDDVILQAHMRATLDAADVATNLSTTLPWEDVYTGLALSEAAHGADLAYVHVGCEVYSDEWGFFAAPSTLIWHMRSKIASRIRELQAWSESRHCAPPGRLECGDDWSGCNGQRWRRCEWRYDAPPPPAAANGTAAAGGCSVGFANLLPHKKLRIPSSTYTCTRP